MRTEYLDRHIGEAGVGRDRDEIEKRQPTTPIHNTTDRDEIEKRQPTTPPQPPPTAPLSYRQATDPAASGKRWLRSDRGLRSDIGLRKRCRDIGCGRRCLR